MYSIGPCFVTPTRRRKTFFDAFLDGGHGAATIDTEDVVTVGLSGDTRIESKHAAKWSATRPRL